MQIRIHPFHKEISIWLEFCPNKIFYIITKYGRILYIGMDEVLAHYASTFENSNLHCHFQR